MSTIGRKLTRKSDSGSRNATSHQVKFNGCEQKKGEVTMPREQIKARAQEGLGSMYATIDKRTKLPIGWLLYTP